MYEQYFALRERAFDLGLNPRHFVMMPSHREALANIEYALHTKQGITLLIGDAGTGKTLVLRRALVSDARTGTDRTMIYVGNPALTRAEFFELLADRFDLGTQVLGSKTRLLKELDRRLREQREVGRAYVLVIDEAQSIPDELLEEIRLLRNIAMDTELLPLILSGQPELAERLAQPHLRQLKQRIALRCFLAPLTVEETAGYIAGRIRLAGGDPGTLFSREAVLAVHEHSRGIPRTISVICENALLAAFGSGQRRISREIILDVARDLDFRGPAAAAPAEHRGATASVHTFRSAPSRSAPPPDRAASKFADEISRLQHVLTQRVRPQQRTRDADQ